MNKMKLATLALLVSFGLAACGGGGGGTSTGGTYFSHSELAEEFVYRLNIDMGYDVSLAKTNTLQFDYIVVYDYDYGTYDAYYIGAYNPGESLYNYLNTYDWDFYYDLIPEPGNTYYHPESGLTFEKGQGEGKNLTMLKAFSERVKVEKAAKKVRAEYGLSEEKALDVARFAYNVQTAPEGTYKAEDFDKFSKELTGSTITQFQNDVKEGDAGSLARRIEMAASKTGMGPEAMNHLIENVFLK